MITILTNNHNIDTNLCMAGKIRTKEFCPKCSGKYKGTPLICPTCLTTPKRYFIDLWEKGRLKIYSDRQGHPLDSYHRAARVLEAIRYEMDQHLFDSSKYSASDLKDFLFETRIEAWYQSKYKEAQKGILAESYTKVLYCYINNYYLKFFMGMDTRDIRTYTVNKFYEQLPVKSSKYIKNIINALENFFNSLHEEEFINSVPTFPTISVEEKAPKWVNLETQIKILDTIPSEDRDIIAFLSFQGTRPGEGFALKVKDINFETQSVTISRTFSDGKIREKVKGKRETVRLINPVLIPILERGCKNKFPESFVFVNPRTGGPYREGALRRLWDKVRIKLNIDMTPYQATRHSLASIAINNGAALTAIKDVLGHTDIRTTMKYAHTNLKSQEVVFNKHNEILELCPQTVPKQEVDIKK